MKKIYPIILILNFISTFAFGQSELLPFNPKLKTGYWPAHWITCPNVPAESYGVFHFRKNFELKDAPKKLLIHVTADNRYHLFVNGESVGRGPARGDLYNWNVETYDIATFLHSGKNVIAALVWNMGEFAPMAQLSARTGFLLQADNQEDYFLNSNATWKVLHDSAYSPCATDISSELETYLVTGPGDEVVGKNYPWDWETLSYDDTSWQQVVDVPAAAVTSGYGSDNVWTLVPSMIPQMEYRELRLKEIRYSTPIAVNDTFTDGRHPLSIQPHQNVSLILDQSYETVAYPVLSVSGGEGSKLVVTYAEAAVDSQGRKGNRDDIDGKFIRGLYDVFYPDGKSDRFEPLWVRTYRYIKLDIQTADNPVTINDFYGVYTGYPFERVAEFESNDSSLQKIWEVAWHTARLCAGETYFDCPYYEELQYEGDTRIQALISLYNTRDDRLMRKAIHDFYDSRTPDGLTQGRFPSHRLQEIPPYSLFWISMLHDYLMLRDDTAFVKQYLSGIVPIIDWYEKHIDMKYEMLGPMNWWNFVDWNLSFIGGIPDGAEDGHSSVITEQFIYTLHQAADLLKYFGEDASRYERLAGVLTKGVYEHCFDVHRMEMANTPEKVHFSQHASIFGVLAGVIPENQQQDVMRRVLTDTTLSQVTYYFRFYLTKAMVKAGLGDEYYDHLTPWRDMLKIGLTTFSETPEPTRSDCHAWSASPAYDFLSTICGIQPAEPRFGKVAIVPHLGSLQNVSASMPHPKGEIKVHLERTGKSGLTGSIELPEGVDGYILWNHKRTELHGGVERVVLQ
ncbi:MAG TPA: alpha-L-rhamnosidase C-terminal domain-containing protein [Candidatus Kryptonia bacterium]